MSTRAGSTRRRPRRVSAGERALGPLGRRGRSAGGVCAARCLTRLGRQPCGTKGGSRSAPSGRDVGPTRGTVTSRARPGEPHGGTCSRVAAVSAGAWRARWAGAGGAPTDGVRAGVRICRWARGSSGLASQTAGALRAEPLGEWAVPLALPGGTWAAGGGQTAPGQPSPSPSCRRRCRRPWSLHTVDPASLGTLGCPELCACAVLLFAEV